MCGAFEPLTDCGISRPSNVESPIGSAGVAIRSGSVWDGSTGTDEASEFATSGGGAMIVGGFGMDTSGWSERTGTSADAGMGSGLLSASAGGDTTGLRGGSVGAAIGGVATASFFRWRCAFSLQLVEQ